MSAHADIRFNGFRDSKLHESIFTPIRTPRVPKSPVASRTVVINEHDTMVCGSTALTSGRIWVEDTPAVVVEWGGRVHRNTSSISVQKHHLEDGCKRRIIEIETSHPGWEFMASYISSSAASILTLVRILALKPVTTLSHISICASGSTTVAASLT